MILLGENMKKKRSSCNVLLLILLGFCICTRGASQGRQPVKFVNACTLSLNVSKRSGVIVGDSLKNIIRQSEDDCNLRLIDSIAVFFLRKEDSLSYKCLAALASCCDGYLTDYFIEKIGLIYRKKFTVFFNFLYFDYKRGHKNDMANFLVEYWSSEASLSDAPNQAVMKIKLKATQFFLMSKTNDSDKRKYLDLLLSRINPEYLD